MNDETYIELDEDQPQEIVHWFDRRPVIVTPAQASAALAGAFALGLLSAVGLLALTGRLRD